MFIIKMDAMKFSFGIVCYSLLLLMPSTTAGVCPPPCQKGSPYTFSQTFNSQTVTGQELWWLVRPLGASTFFNTWICYFDTPDCVPRRNHAFIPKPNNATVTDFRNGTYQVDLTIYNVSEYIDGYQVKWQLRPRSHTQVITNESEPCDVEVYDFPSTPSCDEPKLENKGSTSSNANIHLTVKCSIANVYPVPPNCELKDYGNGQPTEIEATPIIVNSSYHCTLTMPVTNLVPQQYNFQLLMYPDVTNGRNYGKTGSPVIDLSLPKPTCEDPRLTNNIESVTVTCTISSVFTGFICDFQKKTGAIGEFQRVSGHRSHITIFSCSNSPPVTCDSTCALTVLVSDLGAGVHRLKVAMGKDGYGSVSDSTNAIDLIYPGTSLVNCPNKEDDYIKQGTTATCQCNLTFPGYPPGKAQFVFPNQTEVGDVVNGKLTLAVRYNPNDKTPQVYYCQGVTPLPYVDNLIREFRPRFAYGPASITEFTVPEVYDRCPPSDPIPMEGTCNIDTATVNPEPIVTIKVPGMNDLVPSYLNTSGMYRFPFSFTPQPGSGNLRITCLAYNSKFAELSESADRAITVRAPPTKAPVMSINDQTLIPDGQVVNVTSGQSVQVHCNVQGGDPPVTNVTITCGSRQNVTQGTQASLSLEVDKTNDQEVCRCTAEHTTGCYDKSTAFTFEVAFGPENVSATLASPAVIKLCPSPAPRETIDIDCDVATSGISSKPRVVVESLDNVIQLSDERHTLEVYRFHFSFIPSHGGIWTVKCVAYNAMLPLRKVEDRKIVTVLEPPLSPPSMSVDSLSNIQNGQTVNVTNGQPVQVQCHVQGGFPSVTKVSMTCAGVTYESQGTQLTQSMTLNKTNNNDTCVCSAAHPSECYDNSTGFTFNVQYTSQITNYTVLTPTQQVHVTKMDNSDSSLLEVPAGTLVTFVCEGEGNPRPGVKVKGQKSIFPIASQVTPSGRYENKAVAIKTMACRDTAFYVCEASNGIGRTSTHSVLVSVLCTPELPEEDSEPKTYNYRIGTDLKIEIRILGQPGPTDFTLTKEGARTKRSTDNEEIKADRYNATYESIDELYGRVSLVMYGMTEGDNGKYRLTIGNGIGDGLTYEFSVDMAKEEDSSSNNIGPILGGIIGALVLIAVVVVIILVIIFLRKKGQPVKTDEEMYENDKSGFKVPDMRRKQHVTAKKLMADTAMTCQQDVDIPQARTQYEEIDVPTARIDDVNSKDLHKGKANAAYEDIDCPSNRSQYEEIDHPTATHGNVAWQGSHKGVTADENPSTPGQRPSRAEGYEHAYNLLARDADDRLGTTYVPLDRSAAQYENIEPDVPTLDRRRAGYENVTLVPQLPGTKC